jgi:glutathione S-transferase
MSLTIYGSPRSRTMRVLWLAEELGLTFDHVPYEFDDPRLKQPEFLHLNPFGAIPTIVDNGYALSESLAINLYLARVYGSNGTQLYGETPQEEASMWQWTLWAQGHLEPWVQKDLLLRDLIQAIGEHAQGMVYRAIRTLDTVLQQTPWLVGGRFTVADLNVAGVLSPSRAAGLDLERYPNVTQWLRNRYARPAAVRVREKYAG